jgi:hypothetical protein
LTAAPPPVEMLGAFKLARLLIGLRLRSFRNAFRARARGRSPMFVTAVVLGTGVAYVGLLTHAFGTIARHTDLAGQITALALVVGMSALGSLAARAASNEAVRAGSPENEFLMARPLPLSSLVTARGVTDAVTDPVGGLFLLPVLIAVAMAWRLGWAGTAVAVATAMLAQVTISMLAYAVQLAGVRYVSPARRRALWTGLRLVAALSLAMLWMLASWVLRAPAALADHVTRLAPAVKLWPGALLAAPLAGLARGEPLSMILAMGALVGVAACAMLLAAAVARRAGMHGWEEAGAVWADVSAAPRPSPRPPTAATKDLRLILRDRPQLLALVAMPAIFVGVQVFGAAGWDWTTGNLERVACLAYSLALYMATIGPLTHMQAERRAFWILRTVPVPLGEMFAAKARAWSVIVGGTAAVVFVAFAAWLPDVPMVALLATAFLVVLGAVVMSFVAVAMAAGGADLADDHISAVGPTTIYSFVLVGGLYNLVLVETTPVRGAGLALYAFACWSYWRAGIEHGTVCMDAEAGRVRHVRASDGATMLLVYALGARALEQAAAQVGAVGPLVAYVMRFVLLAIIGVLVAIYLARRKRSLGRVPALASVAIGLGAGALAGVANGWLGGPAALPKGLLGPGVLAILALQLAAEELIYRGVIQRGIENEVAYRPGRFWVGRIGAATVSTALGGIVAVVSLQGHRQGADGAVVLSMLAAVVVSHGAAALTRASTGVTAAAYLARLVSVAVATFTWPMFGIR